MVKTILGIVWASPVTLVSLLVHIIPLWALRGYEYVGRRDKALVWALRPTVPKHLTWLKESWKGWGGQCGGNVIVLREHPDRWNSATVLAHEQVHVRQVMTLGVFHPLIYGACWLAVKICHPKIDAYSVVPFEVCARIEAGQKPWLVQR